jgi:hypothetical protein
MKSTFKEVKFVMNKRQPIFPRSLFEGESSIFINRPMDEMSWPTSRNGKVICCTMPFKMSNLHYNWWEFGQLLKAIINSPLEVPPPGYGQIYKILSGQNPNKKQYEITIGNLLACTCFDFVKMIFSSLNWQRKWMHYKHMCFIACHVYRASISQVLYLKTYSFPRYYVL